MNAPFVLADRRPLDALLRWAAADAKRLGLWAPVAFGAGSALYFAFRAEPAFWTAPALVAISAALAVAAPRIRVAAIGVGLAALGFAVADVRTALVAAPRMEASPSPRWVVGRIVSTERAPDRVRLIVAVRAVEGTSEPSARVRVSWRGAAFAAGPGDLVRFRAVLGPPPTPQAPGGFDYAQRLYFERIGGVGFAVSEPRLMAESRRPFGVSVAAAVETLRETITRRVLTVAPGQGGALVAASITGDRAAVSAETEAALRDSGLAHLIAISGLNMALATGVVFFATRAALAAVPAVALRFPIKKWAALVAFGAGLFYIVISGGAWSAWRAFIMAAVVLVAVLVDRHALTMRNVAVAATIILVLTPEAVTQPGFQMSFAAVVALVAAYEWSRARKKPDDDRSLLARVQRYGAGLVATDIVASTATGFFSVHHFHRAALFGLPANVLAGPLVAFVLMPFAVLGVVLMPFGADALAFRIAALGGEGVVIVGHAVAALPGGILTTPQAPAAALVLATAGGLWLCINHAPWRLAGLAPIALALIVYATARPPDLLVSAKGDLLALSLPGERALAVEGPAARNAFTLGVWMEAVGLDADRDRTTPLRLKADCEDAICRIDRRGVRLAVTLNAEAAARVCAAAGVDLVIALNEAPATCGVRTIGPGDSHALGAHAVTVARRGAIAVRTVSEARGKRPWSSEVQ